MDENTPTDQSQNPKEPTSAPIMDVQPVATEDEPATSNTDSVTSTESISQPPTESTDKKPLVEEPAPLATADVPKQPEPAVHKHGVPATAVIVAIVIAAVLALVTIMAFKNAEKAVAPVNNTSVETQQEEPATPESIDETTTEIDQALEGADEAADFPDEEISDETLGL